MPKSKFEHVKITGITAVVPEHFINIDDEIEFFNNDLKLLERNKKFWDWGRVMWPMNARRTRIYAKPPQTIYLSV